MRYGQPSSSKFHGSIQLHFEKAAQIWKKSLITFVFSDLWNDNSQFLLQKSLPLHLEWLLEHFLMGSGFWHKKHPVFSSVEIKAFSFVEFKSIDFKAVETSQESPDCSMFFRISDLFLTLQLGVWNWTECNFIVLSCNFGGIFEEIS